MKRITKEEMFMRITTLISQRSTCSRLRVGTIITNRDMTNIISMGYNGNYTGGPNECDHDEPGNCGCIHSEINALIKCQSRPEVMFVTQSPCLNCAKSIINSGITSLYYGNDYRKNDGLKLLSSKLRVIKLKS